MTRMTGRPYDPQRPRDRRSQLRVDRDAQLGLAIIGGTLIAFFILALTVLR